MKKIVFYPNAGKKGYSNPYCQNYKDSLKSQMEVETRFEKLNISQVYLFLNLFSGDIYILNWIEDLPNHKFSYLQFAFVKFCVFIIKIRRKKIIWMFHNFHSHSNNSSILNFKTRNLLLNKSDLIISHSKDGAQFANQYAHCKVIYKCHPVAKIIQPLIDSQQFDVLIWGDIFPYKGVSEFLNYVKYKTHSLRIKIIGKCVDNYLICNIKESCSKNVIFENRRASLKEIYSYVQSCKYVLFPYIGDSISSSGALIDTIAMGGTPIGPCIGAFKDLSDEGVCLSYNSYDELYNILVMSKIIISQKIRNEFVIKNSWENFANCIYKEILDL